MFVYRLINGSNITVNDENMWLVPYTEGESHIVTIEFEQPMQMAGLRFWNYNKSPEDTYRGVGTYMCIIIYIYVLYYICQVICFTVIILRSIS